MKKLALTSLMAVFAVSGAHAANVIDGNPLYMPGQNHFYSVTSLGSHTEGTPYTLGEEFGYGITDKVAVAVETSATENKAFDEYFWNDLSLTATFRALDLGGWKADLYGAYQAGDAGLARLDAQGALMYHFDDETEWFDKDATLYTWKAGIRGGYTTSVFTVAGHVEFAYAGDESFDWNDEGVHTWTVGVDGQYVINDDWNLVAGIEYKGLSDSWADNNGVWTGEFGVNYNIDSTKFVGAYVNAAMDHWKDNGTKGWEVEDGFGYGVKFGIDF